MQPDYSKSQRIEARVTAESKNLIKHAADIQGRDVSDFLIVCAEKEARRVIKEQEILTLSRRDKMLFIDAFFSEEEPSANLKRSMNKYLKASKDTK